jgi:hypothetical protein
VRLVERDTAEGRDEYGWADASMLAPPPLDPERELAELRVRVEKVAGEVDQPPPKTVDLPSAGRPPQPADIATFLELARSVRWLRGFMVDFETWSKVAGRLR